MKYFLYKAFIEEMNKKSIKSSIKKNNKITKIHRELKS